MLLNRRGEYALLGLLYLARQDRAASSGRFWDVSDVARSVGVPEKFLRILFHRLAKAGLLRSQRGAGGGFSLKKSAATTTVREVIEAIQGPIAPFVCVAGDNDPEDCQRFGRCELYGLLREVRLKIVEELDRHTLGDLIGVELSVPGACGDGSPVKKSPIEDRPS
jgi:Rrf2 family iron-sulfur cluster assembly transcriptional regulator